ncbi:MAG: TauD/TfdA family dioxygenase [Inquilinus limosus]|uniref:TauD/TfdA family dioxygenase n=1 Tax=Inquilinus limosus TaxID=171674 RepID=A0A952FK82_9PROT|nr:TauD/TfdA family dioxygenase [Inquilinus limosus]
MGDFYPDSGLDLRPIAGRIGAEIRGLRLSGDLDVATLDRLRAALHRHKVIFLRGQDLDDAGQEAFARALGDPVAHPTQPVATGADFLLELDSTRGQRANSWHTDVTFVDAYPQASILRAVTVPEFGGDTIWANTATAYLDLPAPLRGLADQLWALHSNDYDYAAAHPEATPERLRYHRDVFASTVYETEHPVVRVHPVTGEHTLVLGHFVRRFLGLSANESAQLFVTLQAYVTRPENTVRWQWQAGDVAIWDNRATQHYAVNDYGDRRRVVRRATIAGDIPAALDGRRSVTRVKAAREARPEAAAA